MTNKKKMEGGVNMTNKKEMEGGVNMTNKKEMEGVNMMNVNEILKELPPLPEELLKGMKLVAYSDSVAVFDGAGDYILIGTPGGWLRIPVPATGKSLALSTPPWGVLALVGIPIPPPGERKWNDELTAHVVNHPFYVHVR